MRRFIWITGLLAALSNCGDHDGNGNTPDAAPPAGSTGTLDGYRCRIASPVWWRAGEGAENPWLIRGSDGPLLLTRLAQPSTIGWNSANHAGALRALSDLRPGAVAWTGQRILTLAQGRVESFSAGFDDRRLVRAAVPTGGTDATLVELPGRAALVGHRTSRGVGTGAAFVQFLGPDGEAVGAVRALQTELGALVSEVRGRWDFGRLVVVANDEERLNAPFWVLDPEGALLHVGTEGTAVACPRGGCLRVSIEQEGNGDGQEHPLDGVLRVEAIDNNTAFTTNTRGTAVRAVAVSGDRVLVMMQPSDGATGCDLRVIDVSRRAVVGEGSDFHDDGLACEPERVRPTAKGFVLAVLDPAHGVGTRAIECGR